MVWTELMKAKANPNSSPLEGGGQMVLLFYNPLPLGTKMVAFCSQKRHDLIYAQEAIQENMMALICQIPVDYPFPEEVQLQVYNYNQIIARTTFVFYQQTLQMPPPSDMILQILSSQLQSHFPNGNGMGGADGGRSNGDQMSGSGGYGNYMPNSMYHLLLGACRLGCEPLVHCLLSSPVMEELTQEQMKEAYECALSNGHESLSEVLMELVVLHEMAPTVATRSGYIPRGLGNSQSEQIHVPAYYAVLDELQQGGDSPQARAETVLKQLLTAMKDYKEKEQQEVIPEEEEVRSKEEEVRSKEEPVADKQPEDVTTPIIEITPNLAVDKLTVQMDKTTLSPKRRLSSSAKLTRQSNSISDEDDNELKSPAVFHSRDSWAEVNDTVSDLVSHKKKHPYTQQSDADSAIGLSFEEDLNSLVNSEMQRRRSSLLLPHDMISQHNDSITIKMTSDIGLEVANGLEYEGYVVVTEDYPPSQEKKILCKGDRIIQIGDKLIRGMSALDFSELFQIEATSGTTIKIIPGSVTSSQQPIESSPLPQQRSLKRTPSEQFSDIKTKINQLTYTRPPSIERQVTLSRTPSGYPIKMIGGKTVGVFVSDVRPDLTQVYPGDEILELNGHSTKGLTLYDANQIVQTTSGDLRLSVVENKTKFVHVREQVEIDSMYLRSRVDYKPINNREMTLKKGSILRVVNTCSLSNNWLAWMIDEESGVETQLKKILPPTTAKMQFGCDAYERVERSGSPFCRPLFVTGPESDRVAKLISDKPKYNLCESFEQILGTCSEGTSHAVMSVKDPKHLDLLKALQPIVFQTPSPLSEQFAKISVNSFLTGENSSDLAQQAIAQMHKLQDLPIWKPVGVV